MRQRLGRGGHSQGTAGWSRSWKRQERILFWSLQRDCGPAITLILDFWPQNCEAINYCCFRPLYVVPSYGSQRKLILTFSEVLSPLPEESGYFGLWSVGCWPWIVPARLSSLTHQPNLLLREPPSHVLGSQECRHHRLLKSLRGSVSDRTWNLLRRLTTHRV